MTPRERHLLRKYGITLEQYDVLLKRQHQRCAICERPASSFKVKLSVDHNHKTGELRGLLCTYCNRYVIGRHTDAELFKRAYEYLQRGTGWFVPVLHRKKRKRKKRIKH